MNFVEDSMTFGSMNFKRSWPCSREFGAGRISNQAFHSEANRNAKAY